MTLNSALSNRIATFRRLVFLPVPRPGNPERAEPSPPRERKPVNPSNDRSYSWATQRIHELNKDSEAAKTRIKVRAAWILLFSRLLIVDAIGFQTKNRTNGAIKTNQHAIMNECPLL